MPYLKASLNPDDPTQDGIDLNLDQGCASEGCVSTDAFQRDREKLLRYGRLVAIEPVEIQLYEEGAVVQTELMVVGEAVYPMNFFVVPKGSFEYIAGNAFAATFDVCPRVSKGYATIAIKQQYLHAYGVMPHRPWWSSKYGNAWVATQKLPLYWKGRMMNIRVKDDGR